MPSDGGRGAELEAAAVERRLQRLLADDAPFSGLGLAARWRRRRLDRLRGRLDLHEQAWNRRGLPPSDLVELRGRLAQIEEFDRGERWLRVELLARLWRAAQVACRHTHGSGPPAGKPRQAAGAIGVGARPPGV